MKDQKDQKFFDLTPNKQKIYSEFFFFNNFNNSGYIST